MEELPDDILKTTLSVDPWNARARRMPFSEYAGRIWYHCSRRNRAILASVAPRGDQPVRLKPIRLSQPDWSTYTVWYEQKTRHYTDRSPVDQDSAPPLFGRLPSFTSQWKTMRYRIYAIFCDKDLEFVRQKEPPFRRDAGRFFGVDIREEHRT